MSSAITLAACLASLATLASGQESVAPAPPLPLVENLGLQTISFQANDRFVAFLVNEVGNQDLNGDGDSLDHVAFVHRPRTGETINLGIAAASLEQNGPRAVFLVPEGNQATSDLNGDGDTHDAVLALYDDRNGFVSLFDQATFTYKLGQRLLVYMVNETNQGNTDINGDGSAGDHVVFVRDLETGATLNTYLAGFPNARTGLRVEGPRAAFIVPELLQDQDLNGDGDKGDPVMHVVDVEQGGITNLGIANSGLFEWSAGYLAFTARESSQAADLNGDGDRNDNVLHVLRPGAVRARNVGTAVSDLAAGPDYFAYRESEGQQGQDLNGDGDLADQPLTVVTLDPPRRYRTGMDALPSYGSAKGFVGFEVPESGQGSLDQNGDGDTLDAIAHVFDVRAGLVRSLKTTSTGISMGARHVLVRVSEAGAGDVDLDGDGIIEDEVVQLIDPRTVETLNPELSAVSSFLDPLAAESLRRAVIYVVESTAGVDLNGDGDLLDDVPHFVDPRSGRSTSLGVSGWRSPAPDGFVLTNRALVFFVLESSEGRDLNGDGDLYDRVLHVAR